MALPIVIYMAMVFFGISWNIMVVFGVFPSLNYAKKYKNALESLANTFHIESTTEKGPDSSYIHPLKVWHHSDHPTSLYTPKSFSTTNFITKNTFWPVKTLPEPYNSHTKIQYTQYQPPKSIPDITKSLLSQTLSLCPETFKLHKQIQKSTPILTQHILYPIYNPKPSSYMTHWSSETFKPFWPLYILLHTLTFPLPPIFLGKTHFHLSQTFYNHTTAILSSHM